MAMEAALRTRLLADADITARVSERIDWTLARQGQPLPSIVLTMVSDPRPQNFSGFEAMRQSRVQVDVRAETALAALQLRDLVIAALVPAALVDGVQFRRGFVDAVRDASADTPTGFIHRQSVDFLIWHDG